MTNKKILAHRGLHQGKSTNENTTQAMLNAFSQGFGVEVDIRVNSEGSLVTGHDYSQTFNWKEALTNKDRTFIAFHIKEEGLCSKLFALVEQYSYLDYIIFGASAKEMKQYLDIFGYDKIAFEYNAGDVFDDVYNCRNKNIWIAELDGKKTSKKELILLKSLKKSIHLVMQDCHNGDPILFGIRLVNYYDGLLDSICTDSPLTIKKYVTQ